MIHGLRLLAVVVIMTGCMHNKEESVRMNSARPNETALDEVALGEQEFAAAWANPSHTRIELPELDVNQQLATSWPLRITSLVLWDAELRKALDPSVYIPEVVQASQAWAREQLPSGNEVFWRMSQQRAWAGVQVVIERVLVNHRTQRITFLGRAAAVGDRGQPVLASAQQPLFFVEHSVKGSRDAPRVAWRMVHLTNKPDAQLLGSLHDVLDPVSRVLPGYLRIYLEQDLGIRQTVRTP